MKVDERSPRRSSGTGLILGIVAALSAFGAVAAWIGNRANAPRIERYASDASCQASSIPDLRVKGACSVGPATVTSRYVRTYKGSHYYRLVVQSSDGVVDSIEPKGAVPKTFWEAATPGTELVAQRFTEVSAGKRHITRVSLAGREMRTEWNPIYQAGNTELGIWFLGCIAVVSSAFLLRARMRTDAAEEKLAT